MSYQSSNSENDVIVPQAKSYSTFPTAGDEAASLETPLPIETESSSCLSHRYVEMFRYPLSVRSLIIFKLCIIVFAGAGLSSTMLFATIPSIIVDLQTTEVLVDLSLIMFHLFLILSLGEPGELWIRLICVR